MTLAALIRKGGLLELATATSATSATQQRKAERTVARVATVAVATPEQAAETPIPDAIVLVDARHEGFDGRAANTRSSRESELLRLVDRIADAHGFTPEERAEAARNALADQEAALECFRALVEELHRTS